MKKLKSMKPCANAPLDYKCDFCDNRAILDAPHKSGPWANFCLVCIKAEAKPGWETIGFKLKETEDS